MLTKDFDTRCPRTSLRPSCHAFLRPFPEVHRFVAFGFQTQDLIRKWIFGSFVESLNTRVYMMLLLSNQFPFTLPADLVFGVQLKPFPWLFTVLLSGVVA